MQCVESPSDTDTNIAHFIAFMASERREQPTYAVILTLISHTIWLKMAGCPSLGFTYIAQATRFAQAQGEQCWRNLPQDFLLTINLPLLC